jgi:hypothetical protein
MTMMVRKESIPDLGDRVVGLERHRALVFITFGSGKKITIHISEFFKEEQGSGWQKKEGKFLVKKEGASSQN